MLYIHFIQSSMFRLLEGLDGMKYFLLVSERFVNPNAGQLSTLHISTYKYSNNPIKRIFYLLSFKFTSNTDLLITYF